MVDYLINRNAVFLDLWNEVSDRGRWTMAVADFAMLVQLYFSSECSLQRARFFSGNRGTDWGMVKLYSENIPLTKVKLFNVLWAYSNSFNLSSRREQHGWTSFSYEISRNSWNNRHLDTCVFRSVIQCFCWSWDSSSQVNQNINMFISVASSKTLSQPTCPSGTQLTAS